jgi:hypothetical protein
LRLSIDDSEVLLGMETTTRERKKEIDSE